MRGSRTTAFTPGKAVYASIRKHQPHGSHLPDEKRPEEKRRDASWLRCLHTLCACSAAAHNTAGLGPRHIKGTQ